MTRAVLTIIGGLPSIGALTGRHASIDPRLVPNKGNRPLCSFARLLTATAPRRAVSARKAAPPWR